MVPPDDVLRDAVGTLRATNPTLGIAKFHALLLGANPSWSVSEKRVRRVLQAENLLVPPPSPKAGIVSSADKKIYPTSHVLDDLDIKQWSSKIQIKYFGRTKGKGLIATEKIEEGEVVWKEDPFIIAPEWEIYDLQQSSAACAYCTTPLTRSSLTTACEHSPCAGRFCSRLCMTRSHATHPLLCAGQNPASTELLSFTRKTEWMALHGVIHCTARILLANEKSESARDADWRFVRSLAQLGMEERFQAYVEDLKQATPEPDRKTWEKAHRLVLKTFREPGTGSEGKKLKRILKKPLPDDIIAELFSYEGFLRGLGRMNLNLEAHGGLYMLHSHLNHSCRPNISVRHLDTRSALARITVLAKRAIEPGEELVITYVNPEMRLKARRMELIGWGFGVCQCERCKEEEKSGTEEHSSDIGFESELKAGLGFL